MTIFPNATANPGYAIYEYRSVSTPGNYLREVGGILIRSNSYGLCKYYNATGIAQSAYDPEQIDGVNSEYVQLGGQQSTVYLDYPAGTYFSGGYAGIGTDRTFSYWAYAQTNCQIRAEITKTPPQEGGNAYKTVVAVYLESGTVSIVSVKENSPPTAPNEINVPEIILGGSSIQVSWSESSDPNGNLEGYSLERQWNNTGSWTQIYKGATTNYTDSIPNNTYNSVKYRVRAYDSYGEYSDYKTSALRTIINNVPPNAPTSISATPSPLLGGKAATVRWVSGGDSDGNLSGHILEYKYNDTSYTQLYKGNNTQTTFTVTKGKTTVQFRVKSYDTQNAESSYLESQVYNIKNNTPPTTPTNLVVPSLIVSNEVTRISWNASTDVDGNLTGYEVHRRLYQGSAWGEWTQIYTGANTYYDDTITETGYTQAQYQVRAYDADNDYSAWATSTAVTVTDNKPPTKPGTISVTNVVAGSSANISWGASTDEDGSIASYTVQRLVDNANWTSFYTGAALTTTDTIDEDWATVQYRVFATDDKGANSPYETSQSFEVSDGLLYISGNDSDLGEQNAPFTFTFQVLKTGIGTPSPLTITATLDGNVVLSETNGQISQDYNIEIDTRAMKSGQHVISVQASAGSFITGTSQYGFTVTKLDFPDGGIAVQYEDNEANPLFGYTLASMVLMENGESLADTLHNSYLNASRIETGSYVGSGLSGVGNKNTLLFSFKPHVVVIQQRDSARYRAAMIRSAKLCSTDNTNSSTTVNITWGDESISWYSTTAAAQLNTNATYDYVAIG